MVSKIIELTTRKNFQKAIGFAMFLTVLPIFLGEALIASASYWPRVDAFVSTYMQLAPWILGICVVLWLPSVIKYIIAVKNGAPLFTPPSRPIYKPWPAHSHPVARKTAWGGLDPDNDVTRRRTRFKVCNKNLAKQSVIGKRIVSLVILFLTGAALIAFPFAAQAIVYEVPPPNIVAMQKVARELSLLFIIPGTLMVISGLFMLASKIPMATINKTDGMIRIRHSRFLGLLDIVIKPKVEELAISEVGGVQLISYRSKNKYGGGNRGGGSSITQFELNLVCSNGQRRLLIKQPRSVSFLGKISHQTLLNDAIALAKFLKIPVWDRCGYYQPDSPGILNPIDPVIQPL